MRLSGKGGRFIVTGARENDLRLSYHRMACFLQLYPGGEAFSPTGEDLSQFVAFDRFGATFKIPVFWDLSGDTFEGAIEPAPEGSISLWFLGELRALPRLDTCEESSLRAWLTDNGETIDEPPDSEFVSVSVSV